MFPIEYLHAWDILVEQLMQRILQDLSRLLSVSSIELRHFLLWTCTLGCLATVKTCNLVVKGCFIEKIYFLETNLTTTARLPSIERENSKSQQGDKEGDYRKDKSSPIRDWQQVKYESPVPFIWHSGACHERAQQIWKEVQERVLIEG